MNLVYEGTYGRHVLAEYRGCDAAILDDQQALEALMRRAVLATGAHIVRTVFHRFAPQGVSGVVVIQESHLSIHTWPESGYAAIDFYTCGDCDPTLAHEVLGEGLKAKDGELMLVHRGQGSEPMRTVRGNWQSTQGSARWGRATLLPDPTRWFMVGGSGEGPTTLNAFDHALLSAGVGDTNLVRMSSILPPKTALIEPRPLPPGALVPIAYAEMTSDKPGQIISAVVAVAIPVDPEFPGLIMEYHGEEPLESSAAKVRMMCVAGMEHRGRAIKDIVVKGAEHVVENIGCAFAGLVLWGEKA